MISFLKKDDEAKGGFMGRGDIIFLLVIVAVVGGFWYYSKSIKTTSASHFTNCQKLWEAKDYPAADRCYEEARDLQYLTDSLDSITYLRSDSAQVISDAESALWAKADSAMVKADTARVLSLVKQLPTFYFLDSTKVQRLLSWQAMAKAPSDTSGAALSK
jgi:hypothetical protein